MSMTPEDRDLFLSLQREQRELQEALARLGSKLDSLATRANGLAFRLKLLLAAGLAPALGACATCGETEHLVGFSGAAGGVVCAACEAGSFPLTEASHAFMVAALGRPLAEAPVLPDASLGQVERAIGETLEHHAHLRLKPVAPRRTAQPA